MATGMNFLILMLVFNGVRFFLAKGASYTGGESCMRFEKMEEIGYDSEREEIVEVDVGECQKRPSEVNSTNCIPRHVTEERHLLFTHHHVIQTTKTIQSCQRESSTCQRQPRLVTFYPGTGYSNSIDVGVCGGQCEDDSTMCKPDWTKSKAIPTANGDRCFPVIETCSCVNRYCYRESNFEGFSEMYPVAKGNNATRTKEIDVGKCVSEAMCPVSQTSNVPSSLPFPILSNSCRAETYKYHAFVSSGGRRVNISAVASCSCQS